MIKKIAAFILVSVLILNLVFFAMGKIALLWFWVIIGIIGAVSYFVYRE